MRLQIFNRSFSTKSTGRGLGTYSMKYLTEKYLRGEMSFTSVEGEGTTFLARYPLGPEKMLKGARPAPRVLVADDEHVLRLMLRAALTRAGCEVVEASNGAEALLAARTQRPDVVLLDVNMPVLSGEAALVALRAELPGVLVLMLTAEEDPALDARCLALGSARCLKKSTALPDLVVAVLQTWNDAPAPAPLEKS